MRPLLRHPFFWALLAALLLHGSLLFIHWQPSDSLIWQPDQDEGMAVLLEDWPDTPMADMGLDEDAGSDEVETIQEPAPEPPAAAQTPPAEPLSEPVTPTPDPEPPTMQAVAPAGSSLLARSLEIARLESQLQAQQTAQASRPRVRRISSGARLSAEEALYLKQWEARVERIGNLNYPEEARRQNLGGRLRLLVVINANGDILEAQLLTSSGHRLLDDAAIRILNLAAPFAPLPASIRAEAEVLEIIRTWQFGDGWHAN